MPEKEIFMNLRTDFAFKWVFGSEIHKKALIRFLNVLFKEDNLVINDVVFHDKEVLPSDNSDSIKGKRIIYDVYCTSLGKEHHFILEMQQEDNGLFCDRSVYYAAKALSMQGLPGWDYSLCPVFSIFILGFNLSHLSKKLIHDFRLIDKETHEILNDKLRMIFISLPEVKRKWGDCKTSIDKLLFIIKNIHTMTKESEAYKSGEYNEIFDAAEIGSMAKEDVVLYSQSYYKMRENEMAIEYAAARAAEAAAEEGRKEGRKEGIMEGIMETEKKNALKMKEIGLDREIILAVTGIDINNLE